ncbi:MAG: hypothetical protein ABJL55_16500 [Roseibium sp.]
MRATARPKTARARARLCVDETLASLARHAKDAENKGLIGHAADIRSVYNALDNASFRITPEKPD